MLENITMLKDAEYFTYKFKRNSNTVKIFQEKRVFYYLQENLAIRAFDVREI